MVSTFLSIVDHLTIPPQGFLFGGKKDRVAFVDQIHRKFGKKFGR